MAVTIPTPAKVIPLSGDSITVQLVAVPGVETEVNLHILRNGARAERFSLTELAQVLTTLQTLLGQARTRTLGVQKP